MGIPTPRMMVFIYIDLKHIENPTYLGIVYVRLPLSNMFDPDLSSLKMGLQLTFLCL